MRNLSHRFGCLMRFIFFEQVPIDGHSLVTTVYIINQLAWYVFLIILMPYLDLNAESSHRFWIPDEINVFGANLVFGAGALYSTNLRYYYFNLYQVRIYEVSSDIDASMLNVIAFGCLEEIIAWI